MRQQTVVINGKYVTASASTPVVQVRLSDRIRKGDRSNATQSEIDDGDRAQLILAAMQNDVACGQRHDAMLRGEDPAIDYSCDGWNCLGCFYDRADLFDDID